MATETMTPEQESVMAPVTCPRCKRTAVGWMLKRADVCAPKGWAHCLREPSVIRAKRVA